jgi:hypothetical protein
MTSCAKAYRTGSHQRDLVRGGTPDGHVAGSDDRPCRRSCGGGPATASGAASRLGLTPSRGTSPCRASSTWAGRSCSPTGEPLAVGTALRNGFVAPVDRSARPVPVLRAGVLRCAGGADRSGVDLQLESLAAHRILLGVADQCRDPVAVQILHVHRTAAAVVPRLRPRRRRERPGRLG